MTTSSRTVAVTGASRGLGAAMALELARRGLTVGCLSRKGAGPEDAAAEGCRAGARAVERVGGRPPAPG